MADNVYGFTDSKSRVQVVDKATQDATDNGQNSRISALETQGTDHEGRLDTVEEAVDKISAGNGIKITDGVIEHTNSINAQGSFIGSASNALRLKFDAQGHITGVDTDPIYPPTSPGNAGEVWTSDGSGPGLWKVPITIDIADDPNSPKTDTGTNETTGVWYVNDSSEPLYITAIRSGVINFIAEGKPADADADADATFLYAINWDNYKGGEGASTLNFIVPPGYYYRFVVNTQKERVWKGGAPIRYTAQKFRCP